MPPSEPDLTAELDAAEDVITGRAAEIVTQWGWRDHTGDVFVMHNLGAEAARALVAGQRMRYRDVVLVRRTVTYGPWEEETA